MFLKKLSLVNFRNYSGADFKFKNPITVLMGDNAQGKSNFLESIYFLATSKSPKAEREEELIKNGEQVLRVEGEIVSQYQISNFKFQISNEVRSGVTDEEVTSGHYPGKRSKGAHPEPIALENTSQDSLKLEMALQILEGLGLKKRARVNGISRRVVDYSENLAVVLFSPEDVNLVIGSPSLRRGYVDQVLSQTHRSYKRALTSYESVVSRKNKVLKRIREGSAKINELDFWYDQQVMLGNLLTCKRQDFFDFINSIERKFGEFKFAYLENSVSLERLKEYQTREIEAATSLVGPHRDDFMFLLNGRDLSKFGSRGEQRTAVLDLKLSEVSFIEHILEDRPILLLDDIFSELDFEHRKHVIDISKMQQTIIATVDWDAYLEKELHGADIYRVYEGKVESRDKEKQGQRE